MSFSLRRPLKLLFVFLLFKLVLWQPHEPPGAVNNANFCERVSAFVLVRLQQPSRHRQRRHSLVSRGAKHPLSFPPNAGLRRGTKLLPVGASRVGSPAPHPGTHSWWSCRQLEPQPAWASPESRAPRAGRCCLGVTCNTPPCSHLGISGLLQPAPTSELRCCNFVFPTLLH